GAQYMVGAFTAYFLLDKAGLGYWWALLITPFIVGAVGVVIERLMLSRLYKLDHLYGLLLTFGLALIFEGAFHLQFGSAGLPYSIPDSLQGVQNLGFMYLPNYRAWVIFASLVVCLATWFLIERTKLGAHLRVRRGPGGARGRVRGTHLPDEPADGLHAHHRGVRGGGDRRHGLDHGLDRDRLRPGHHRGPHQVLLPAGLEHGDLRDHGHRPPHPAARPLR